MSGWFIIYTEGLRDLISNTYFLALKLDFVLANSADSDEMKHYVVCDLDLH